MADNFSFIKQSGYIGSCAEMCPEREKAMRSGSIFERDAMIKEYRRAGADQEEPLPDDLRTLDALEYTMDYLALNIMDDARSTQDLALDWYDFLWDRLRAIRKDITQQNICDQAAAILVERCTRFHVHSCYAMNRVKDFDSDMNRRNLNDCLQMLRQMYDDLNLVGITCPGELEFKSYDILLHLDDPLSTNVLMKSISNHPGMGYLRDLYTAYTTNNYYKFFKFMEEADYLSTCILSLYANKMRLKALKMIIAALPPRQTVRYPAEIFIETFRLDGLDDLIAFASASKIEVETRNSRYFILLAKDQETIPLPPIKSERLFGRKIKGMRVGQIVYGQQLDTQRIRVRTYEEIIQDVEEEETGTTRTRYTQRNSSAAGVNEERPARVFEVQVDQIGQWERQASNEAGESTCKVDVEAFAEPRIVTDLAPEVHVWPGNEIWLAVEASGSPIPVYSWFKDGIGIAEEEDRVFTETKSTTTTSTTTTTTTSNKRRSSVSSLRSKDGVSISGETLIIKDARPKDEGVYTCKIENRLGQVKSRDSKLIITGHGDDLNSAPKTIKDFSRDQIFQIDEGERIIPKVLAEGHPRLSQQWYKDTEEMIERVTRFETEQDGQENVLKTKRSEQSDTGSYKGVLRNDYGETESRTVEVRVNKISEETESQRRPSVPTIMLDSHDKVVDFGSNVSFDVQVGGHPRPLITWYRNGRRLTESSDGRVSFVEEETTTTIVEEEEDLATGRKKRTSREETPTIHRLVITNVRESDEAAYSLEAENDLGSTKSSLVSLKVDMRKEVEAMRKKMENIMPAGRFRQSRPFKKQPPKNRLSIQPIIPLKKPPAKKSIVHDQTIAAIKRMLDDEKKANDHMIELIKTFN